MFGHEHFDRYAFDEVPLDRDIYLVDEAFLLPYERMMLAFFAGGPYEHVGCVSFATVRKITTESLELSWYANIHDRFHEVSISLPKAAFRCCVGSRTCDEKPRIFVDGAWIRHVQVRSYSVFGLIDAAGVKAALERGQLDRASLVALRKRTDELAAKHLDISFISFADSLLLKSNWSVGHFRNTIRYNYHPEHFIDLFSDLKQLYKSTLALDIYGIFTQGDNEYYDDPLLHISEHRNHICLNSLGHPFAQLQAIERAARRAIRAGDHAPAEIYMDELFYYSLKFKHGFVKHEGAHREYAFGKPGSKGTYFYASHGQVMENLGEIRAHR